MSSTAVLPSRSRLPRCPNTHLDLLLSGLQPTHSMTYRSRDCTGADPLTGGSATAAAGDLSCLARLGDDPDVGFRRLPATWVWLLGIGIGDGRQV